MEHSVALVTGAARGLGRAMAEALLDKGLKVCIADVLGDVGEATAEELGAKYGKDKVSFNLCDVTKQDEFEATWDKCEETLGKVDLLINNAGIGDEQNWKRTLEVNLGGCIAGTVLAYNRMSKKEGGGGGGRVINIASIAGVKTYPFGPIYSATKSGIVGFSRSLGHPLHLSLTGVKVQCLCPALIETSFVAQCVKTPFSPDIAKAMGKSVGSFEVMPVGEAVAALLQLIADDRNGGVLVVEPGKEPQYVEPSLQ